MGEGTKIEWADHTFNPWWGCAKVSPGCEHCYAEAWAKRTGHGVWGKNSPRRFFGEKHWAEPLKWNAAAEREGVRKRVFCASMADVFEDRRDLDDARLELFSLIDKTPWLDWLLLTKRPENIVPIMEIVSHGNFGEVWNFKDHLKNVWLGTTAENQAYWDKRVPLLMGIPATIHFVSVEPLLGPIEPKLIGASWWDPEWVIVGGESGPKARPINPEWVEAMRDYCEFYGIPFFFKQWGGKQKAKAGRLLNGVEYNQIPIVEECASNA